MQNQAPEPSQAEARDEQKRKPTLAENIVLAFKILFLTGAFLAALWAMDRLLVPVAPRTALSTGSNLLKRISNPDK